MKTLLIRTGGLGDTVLTLRAAQWLKDIGHCVSVMAHSWRRYIVKNFGFDFISYENCCFETAYGEPDEKLKDALSPFGLVIAIQSDIDGALSAGLMKVVSETLVRIDPLPPFGYGRRYHDYLIESIASPIGAVPPEGVPRLSSRAAWNPSGEIGLLMHAGSGSRAKNWPLENFLQTAGYWTEDHGGPVTMSIGPAEEGMAEEIEAMACGKGVIVKRNPSPSELVRTIAAADLYIGADSGVTHLAASIGVPVVALFGPTDSNVWGPEGENVIIVESPDGRMESVTALMVMEAAAVFSGRFPA